MKVLMFTLTLMIGLVACDKKSPQTELNEQRMEANKEYREEVQDSKKDLNESSSDISEQRMEDKKEHSENVNEASKDRSEAIKDAKEEYRDEVND